MRLSKQLEKSGYFWQSDKIEEKLPGTLRISDSGKITLELFGVFGDIQSVFSSNNINLERISGVLENGKLITLDNCFYNNRNINFNGFPKSIIFSNYLYEGANYSNKDLIAFNKLIFSVEGLDEWLDISGINVVHKLEEKSATINFDPPNEISIQLPENLKLTFTFSWTLPATSNVTNAKISQKAYIALSSKSLISIKDFLKVVFTIKNFLSFAIDESVSLTTLTGYSNKITETIRNNKVSEIPINIFFQSNLFPEVVPKIKPNKFLFSYKFVTEDLDIILCNWFSNYALSEPAFNLYFAYKAGSHNYMEGKFLSLTQGIETLHRRNSEETIMPAQEFETIVKSVLNACTESTQQLLENALKYSNELSLRQRLKKMIKPFQELYGSKDDCKAFINSVVNTRNYLTHYDKEIENISTNGSDLWGLCMKIEALFQLHFLKLIGLNEESIYKIARENQNLIEKLRL